MRNLFSLSLLLLATISLSAPQAEMKPEGTTDEGEIYRLYLNDERTDVTMVSPTESEDVPVVEVAETKAGAIYGTVQHTMGFDDRPEETVAFIKIKDKVHVFKDMYFAPSIREEVLLIPLPKREDKVTADGQLLSEDKIINIGPTSMAMLSFAGDIVGWYWCTEDGEPFTGDPAKTKTPVFLQNFRWAGGVRELLDRVPADDMQ